MRKLWGVAVVFLWLWGACLAATAETPDPHYASSRTSSVVHQSTFLHGYLHGYEEGFSLADLDLQMARETRNPAKMKEAKNATGYRSEFGSRKVFDAGYLEGFRVGYADSVAGRAFRAVDLIREVMDLPVNTVAAAEQPDPVTPPQPRVPHASALFDQTALATHTPEPRAKHQERAAAPAPNAFDEGFVGGYSSGRRQGLADARSALPFAAPASTCPADMGKAGTESCAAYVRGFAMGYSDGYVNVARPASTSTSASAAQSK